MKSLSLLLALFFINMPAASATGKLKLLPENEVQIVHAEFGLFNPSGFVVTNTVLLVEGQAYGWRMVLKTSKAKVKWREQFILPSAPVSWGDSEAQGINKVSGDRRVSVLELEVPLVDGVVFNAWKVVAGDPEGRHIMRVLIDNQYERVFAFDVLPVAKRQSH